MIKRFQKYQKINESSYPVEKCQGNNWTDDDALPFLIEYDGKVRLGDFGDTHSGRFGGRSVHGYGYAGRMWIREKLMAFWTHPPQDRMEEYMNNLVDALNNSPRHKNAIDEFVRWSNFDIWDFKIDTRNENYDDDDGRPPSLDEVLDTDFTRLIDILIEDSEFDFDDFFSDEEILDRLRDNGLNEKVLRSLNFQDFIDTLSDQVYSDNLKKFLKSDVEFSPTDTEYDRYKKLLDGKSRDELIEISDKLIGIDNFINRVFKYHNKKEIVLKAFGLKDDNDFLVNYIEKKFLRSDIERYISRTVSDSTLDDILERFKEEEYFDDEYELISLKDYARLEETPEDPPEEAYLQHLQSPLLKSKNVKDRFPGYKHKRLAWQLPGELEVQARARMYQEKLTTKFRLFENPHYITLPDGKQQFTNLNKDICFGYYKGRFYSEIGVTHPRLVQELYDEVLLGSTINIREEIEYSGRLFMEQKIVTFWDFPETKEKFREIIKKLEQNHDLNIWNDKEWRVEVIRNSEIPERWWDYSKEVEYIPLDEYEDGLLRWDKKTLQIQHVLSPLLKTKQKIGWKRKKLQGQLPGELDVAARARMFQEKNDNKMLTKFVKFINESLTQEDTKEWFLDAIMNRKGFVKTRNMKEKLSDYIERLFSFSEENKNIDKKELTQIKNAFDKLIGSYYNGDKDFRTVREERQAELGVLAKKKGIEYIYNIEDPEIKVLSWTSFYSVIDAYRFVLSSKNLNFNKEEQEFVDKWFHNVEKWSELHEKFEEIRKILNPTAQEKKDRELKQIKGKLNPKIKDAIDEIAENFRKVIEESELRSYNYQIKVYRERYGDSLSWEQVRKDNRKYGTPPIIEVVYQRPKGSYLYNDKALLVDDWEDIIKKRAETVSFETIAKFKYKMYYKIGGMISDIDKEFDISVSSNNWLYNEITFKFKDGSRFTIKNQIVAKTSILGTNFYTYPTTFHDAFLPNGQKIPFPDEYNVKKAFNDYYGKPTPPPTVEEEE